MFIDHPGHIPIHLNSDGVNELLRTNGSVLLVRDHQKETTKKIDSLVTALCKRIHRTDDGRYVGHTDQLEGAEVNSINKLIEQYGRKHFLVLTRGGRDPLPLPAGVGIVDVEEAIQKEKLGGLMLPDKSAQGVDTLEGYTTPEQELNLQQGVRALKQREREVGESSMGSAPVILRTTADVQAFAKSPGGAIFMLRDDDTLASQTAAISNELRVGAVQPHHVDTVQQGMHHALRGASVILTSTNADGKTKLHQYTGPMEPHSVVGALENLRNAL